MKKSNRPIYSKLPPYYLPDSWTQPLLWRLQAGGGSPGSGWGKDKDDDERNWAVRCAKMAKWLCKPIKRSRGR